MFNFGFLGKGLELVSKPHFVYDFFLRKIFILLYSPEWSNFPIVFTSWDNGPYVYY